MFQVRPEVNWMLIAVGSWPFIRGTLSPSPPGARGPKSYTPTLCLFVQLRRRRRSHRPSDHHSPLGQTFRSPSSPYQTLARARVARNVPLFLRRSERTLPVSPSLSLSFFSEPRVPAMSRFVFSSFPFFSPLTYLRRCTLTALRSVLYDTFSEERWTSAIPQCRKLPRHQSRPRAIPVRTNLELDSTRARTRLFDV